MFVSYLFVFLDIHLKLGGVDMVTDQLLRDFECLCEKLRLELKDDPAKGRERLVRAGILTRKGNLRKPFR